MPHRRVIPEKIEGNFERVANIQRIGHPVNNSERLRCLLFLGGKTAIHVPEGIISFHDHHSILECIIEYIIQTYVTGGLLLLSLVSKLCFRHTWPCTTQIRSRTVTTAPMLLEQHYSRITFELQKPDSVRSTTEQELLSIRME